VLPDDPFTLAALLLATDPEGLGGAVVRGPGGPAPEAWCRFLRASLPEGAEGAPPWRRVPVGITPDRMVGGVELGSTLRSGRRVLLPGIPAQAHGGVLVFPSAERMRPEVATVLLEVLDRGRLRVERDGLSDDLPARVAVVALDEAGPDEPGVPEALRDRVAFLMDLPARWQPGGAPDAGQVGEARAALEAVEVGDEALVALAQLSLRGGGGSLRPVVLALRAARGIAALRGARQVEADDLWLAAALVLAPRGVPLPGRDPEAATEPGEPEPDPIEAADSPAPEAEPGAETQPPPEGASPATPPEAQVETPQSGVPDQSRAPDPSAPAALPDQLVQAVLAALPLELAQASSARSSRGGRMRDAGRGRGGAPVEAHERGRRVGAEPGVPGRGRRLDLPATLRAAAPWQRARAAAAASAAETAGGTAASGAPAASAPPGAPRLRVTRGDLHVQRRVRAAARRTVFLVDASGSQALRRLAEVKGAVELLLAESYRAREEVALVVFRDREARVLLPPTRSLTRARRLLRGLPGGGGTPLARGLAEALRLVESARREGVAPRVVLLTDGRPNVDAAGRGGRPRARADALALAAAFRGVEVRVLDTGLRPEPFLEELADAMGTRAWHLPFADARRIRGALDPAVTAT
jgi:magnesium chelatase subunit D